MFKPIAIKALEDFKIWVNYADGVQGTVDLSHLAHRGVFTIWDDPGVFSRVYIAPESHAIAWSKQVELCPDAIYYKITGKSLEAAA